MSEETTAATTTTTSPEPETAHTESAVINLTEDGGVQKRIIKAGDGPTPPPGAGVSTHYVARLQGSSSAFDSSRGRELPFRFKLGGGRVIRGWEVALPTMRRHELAEVTIAPEYAYGDSTEVPSVPARSTLVYEIELLGWDERVDASPKHDMSITKEVENYGNGLEVPFDGAEVTIDYAVYKGAYGSETVELDKKDFTFVLGDFQTDNLALEAAVLSMRLHEKSRFYFHEACIDLPEAWKPRDISVEITLKALKNPPSAYTLGGPKEALEEAERIKELGNELYKAKDTRMAVRRYRRGIALLETVRKPRPTAEQKEQIKALKVVFYLNIAAACLLAKEFRDAAEACTEALKLSPKNAKALLRRAKAYKAIRGWDDAIRDFKAVLEIEPGNEEAKKLLALSKRGLEEYKKEQSKMYRGMFDRF